LTGAFYEYIWSVHFIYGWKIVLEKNLLIGCNMEKILSELYSDVEGKRLSGKEIDSVVSRLEEKHKDNLPKYNLWKEYLKRSDKYKIVCEWVEDAYNKNPPDPDNTQYFEQGVVDFSLFASTYLSLFRIKPRITLETYLKILESDGTEQPLFYKDSFFMWANNVGFPFGNEMLMNYFVFGNIYNEFQGLSLFRQVLILDFQSKANVYELHEIMVFLFNWALDEATTSLGRNPTFDELRTWLKNLIRDDCSLHITINNPNLSKEDILNRVSDLIDARRNETKDSGSQFDEGLRFESLRFSSNRFDCPAGNLRLDELQRYLKAYDLKKEGKTNKEIAEIIYPKFDPKIQDTKRRVMRDRKNAENIIKNVEQGVFPGKYS